MTFLFNFQPSKNKCVKIALHYPLWFFGSNLGWETFPLILAHISKHQLTTTESTTHLMAKHQFHFVLYSIWHTHHLQYCLHTCCLPLSASMDKWLAYDFPVLSEKIGLNYDEDSRRNPFFKKFPSIKQTQHLCTDLLHLLSAFITISIKITIRAPPITQFHGNI